MVYAVKETASKKCLKKMCMKCCMKFCSNVCVEFEKVTAAKPTEEEQPRLTEEQQIGLTDLEDEQFGIEIMCEHVSCIFEIYVYTRKGSPPDNDSDVSV